MSARKIHDENALISSVLVDPEDINSAFKELKAVTLDITPKGEQFGKVRGQPRLSMQGVIFLHRSHKKPIRARCKDLSLTGIGVCTDRKLKSYRVGEKFKIEFTQHRDLQNFFIEVEIARVNNDPSGTSRVGLRFLYPHPRAVKRIHQFMAYLSKLDP